MKHLLVERRTQSGRDRTTRSSFIEWDRESVKSVIIGRHDVLTPDRQGANGGAKTVD
jgi:hypothetical protein